MKEKTNLRLKWINYAGYELTLSNNKVILLDPCLSIDDDADRRPDDFYQRADYVLLSHTHFDHTKDLSYITKTFDPKVIVGGLSAYELANYFDINVDNVYPVFPNETFHFADFRLTVFRSKHKLFNNEQHIIKNMLSGGFFTDFPFEHRFVDSFGSIEYMDYLITTRENIRIYISGGEPFANTYTDIFKRMEDYAPNIVFRQVFPAYPPEDFAAEISRFHCDYVVPLHHESRKIKRFDYIGCVNRELARLKSHTRLIDTSTHEQLSLISAVMKTAGLNEEDTK